MINLDEAIHLIEVETTSKVTLNDDAEDSSRVILILERENSTFKINVERTRLRQLKSQDKLIETCKDGLAS